MLKRYVVRSKKLHKQKDEHVIIFSAGLKRMRRLCVLLSILAVVVLAHADLTFQGSALPNAYLHIVTHVLTLLASLAPDIQQYFLYQQQGWYFKKCLTEIRGRSFRCIYKIPGWVLT